MASILDVSKPIVIDRLEEIKNSLKSQTEKIDEYKNYLLEDCNYRLPDVFLEFIAREKLDCKYTEDELKTMRESYLKRKEQIERENRLTDIEEEKEKEEKKLMATALMEHTVEEI